MVLHEYDDEAIMAALPIAQRVRVHSAIAEVFEPEYSKTPRIDYLHVILPNFLK